MTTQESQRLRAIMNAPYFYPDAPPESASDAEFNAYLELDTQRTRQMGVLRAALGTVDTADQLTGEAAEIYKAAAASFPQKGTGET